MVLNKTEVIGHRTVLEILEDEGVIPADTLAILSQYSPGKSVQAYEVVLGLNSEHKYARYGTFFSEEAAEKAVRDLGREWGVDFERRQQLGEVERNIRKYVIIPKTVLIH